MNRVLVAFSFLLFSFLPCGAAEDALAPSVSVDEAHKLWTKGNLVIFLDVREDWEWEEGHIEGAVHIPNWTVRRKVKDVLKLDQHIVVYCHSGPRAYDSAELMRSIGYQKVQSMRGGIRDWKGRGFPVIRTP